MQYLALSKGFYYWKWNNKGTFPSCLIYVVFEDFTRSMKYTSIKKQIFRLFKWKNFFPQSVSALRDGGEKGFPSSSPSVSPLQVTT